MTREFLAWWKALCQLALFAIFCVCLYFFLFVVVVIIISCIFATYIIAAVITSDCEVRA